jgi:hypothetical protein
MAAIETRTHGGVMVREVRGNEQRLPKRYDETRIKRAFPIFNYLY